MQLPTLQNTRIRNLADAHKIFYAVEQGILNMITTRLDVAERAALKAGNIYVWEQRKGNSEASGIGIERFTEGRKWSASRIREDFLLYEEKWPTSPTSPDDDTPRNWKPLTKHTYSTVVDLPQGQRKWHITAYIQADVYEDLLTVDDEPKLKALTVPPGHYKTAPKKPRKKAVSSSRPKRKGDTEVPAVRSQSLPHGALTEDRDTIHMFDPYQTVVSSPQHVDMNSHLPGQSMSKGQSPDPSPLNGPTTSSVHSLPSTGPSTAASSYQLPYPRAPVYEYPHHPTHAPIPSHGGPYSHSTQSHHSYWVPSANVTSTPSSSGYMGGYHNQSGWDAPRMSTEAAPNFLHSSQMKASSHLPHLQTLSLSARSDIQTPASPVPASEYHSSDPPSPSYSTYSNSSAFRYHPYHTGSTTSSARYKASERTLPPEEELHRAQAVTAARANTDSVYLERLGRSNLTPQQQQNNWQLPMRS